MPSTITSSDFSNQGVGGSICEQFKEKLLNNNRMRTLLDYLFDDTTGEFASGFFTDLVSVLGPIGKVVYTPKAMDNPNPSTGPVWLLCDGTKYKKDDYPTLSGFLGSTFNALTERQDEVAADEFRVPDMRGRFPMGFDGTRLIATQGGSHTTDIAVPHVHAVGRFTTDGNDARSDNPYLLVSTPSESSPGGLGRQVRGENDNVPDEADLSTVTGKHIISGQPINADGTEADAVSHTTTPPYQAGAFYILAGWKLRGTLV